METRTREPQASGEEQPWGLMLVAMAMATGGVVKLRKFYDIDKGWWWVIGVATWFIFLTGLQKVRIFRIAAACVVAPVVALFAFSLGRGLFGYPVGAVFALGGLAIGAAPFISKDQRGKLRTDFERHNSAAAAAVVLTVLAYAGAFAWAWESRQHRIAEMLGLPHPPAATQPATNPSDTGPSRLFHDREAPLSPADAADLIQRRIPALRTRAKALQQLLEDSKERENRIVLYRDEYLSLNDANVNAAFAAVNRATPEYLRDPITRGTVAFSGFGAVLDPNDRVLQGKPNQGDKDDVDRVAENIDESEKQLQPLCDAQLKFADAVRPHAELAGSSSDLAYRFGDGDSDARRIWGSHCARMAR